MGIILPLSMKPETEAGISAAQAGLLMENLSFVSEQDIQSDFIYHQINDGEDGSSSYLDAQKLLSRVELAAGKRCHAIQ